MRYISFLCIILLVSCSSAPDRSELVYDHKMEILEIMEVQEQAWNKADIEGFMQAYEQSDSLLFIGSSGPSYGYDKVLSNYKKAYPGKEGMGQLKFKVLHLDLIDTTHAHMVGEWRLKFDTNQASGYFSLLWRNLEGEWKIIRDHSS